MKRVAVTGAAGLLGRYVVAALQPHYDVVPIDLKPGPGILVADMLDLAALCAAFAGTDAVVHLAALDAARTASEEAFFTTNTQGCWNALKAAEQNGIRKFVLCSSISAIGLAPGTPPLTLPVPVDHLQRPVSAYGISKQAGEMLAEAFVRRGALDVICLRPCFVMFPHLTAEVAMLTAADEGVPPPPGLARSATPMNEPLTPTRSCVSPEDVAAAFAAALAADLPGFSRFFVAGPDTCSTRPTQQGVQAVFGVSPPAADLYQHNPRAGVFDIAPTRAALGWTPRDSWADMVARATG